MHPGTGAPQRRTVHFMNLSNPMINFASTLAKWLIILAAITVMWETARNLWLNWGTSYFWASSLVAAVIGMLAWWGIGLTAYLTAPRKADKSSETQHAGITQSATASGGSTITPQVKESATASSTGAINQAGRDINIGNQAGRDINIGISESTMLTLLKDKANARDRELAHKYPLGCVLLGVLSDGKVVYEPGPHSVKLDRNNKIAISIDATTKMADIVIGVFNFTDETDRTFNLDQLFIRIPYLENRPAVLPFGFEGGKGPISAYVEVLDESNAIFVIGFKYD
jgi:hypothetical protein